MDDPDPAEQQKEHDDMEAGYDFSSVVGNFVYRNHFQYRAKLYVPKESSWRTNCHIGCFAKKVKSMTVGLSMVTGSYQLGPILPSYQY